MAQNDKNQKFPFTEKGSDEKPVRKGPKFSIYWIYLLIFAILVGSNFWKFPADSGKTTEQEFQQQMLLQGDVQKMGIVRNKEIVRVYIKPDSVGKPFYVKKFSKKLDPASVKDAPIFEFKIADWKVFYDGLRDFYAANPSVAKVPTPVDDDTEWFGPIFNTILSLVLIIGAWILLMRKMGGGGDRKRHV